MATTLTSGTRLGPYELLELLGSGGMGEVYRAHDPRLGRDVAIKVVLGAGPPDEERLRRFDDEARAVAALNHPNVLSVFDVGRHDGTPYLVLELLEGETLRQRLARGALSVRRVTEMATEVCRGLEAAHARGLVHRDLKPENLFLTTDGRVKILDFGLAKLLRGDVESGTLGAVTPGEKDTKTAPGIILGTLGYLSPEQARGLGADARSDLFALGTVLYEAVSGRQPFVGKTPADTLSAILNHDPPAVTSASGPTPPALDRVVQRCLAKEPGERFHSAHDLGLALEAVLDRPTGLEAEEPEDRSPYPGLSSFTESDASRFFGREGEVEALWSRLKTRKLLAVIGPSGAGKTSFVRAGIVASRPPGWGAVVTTPGTSPLLMLGQALAPELASDPEALRQLVRFEDPGAALEVLSRWRKGRDRALLVVDQFEELFTLNPPEVQERFTVLLGRLAEEADVHVLLSMRDDFLMRCDEHPPIAPVFDSLTPLRPLAGPALRRALEEPARTEGFSFEDGLVEKMTESVEGERGALPLLAFAVSQLWERRDPERKRLTLEAYAEIGGVAGALARHAEATLERIGSERQGMVREVFRNLVTSQGTRAACEREELLSVLPDRKAAEEIVGELIGARLLTSYEQPAAEGGEEGGDRLRHRIEIVHESLLKSWLRLVRWQAQDADGALLRDQLRQAAHLWEEKGRPVDLLWSGTSYREYEVWRERYPGQLTAVEEGFARAMTDRARWRRRLRRTVVAGVILALAAFSAAIAVSRHREQAARAHAEAEALRAEASRVLALAELRLDDDPTEALAYATASLELADTEEARLLAMRALQEAPPAFQFPESNDSRMPVFSPDGARLAVGGQQSESVTVWESEGSGPIRLPGHETTPRGPHIALWGPGGTIVTGHILMNVGQLHVWSPDGERLRSIDFGGDTRWQVGPSDLLAQTSSQSPDGRREVLRLRAWRLPHGEARELGRVSRGQHEWGTSLLDPHGRGWFHAEGSEVWFRPIPLDSAGGDRLLARLTAEITVVNQMPGDPPRVYARDESGEIVVWRSSPEGPVLDQRIPRPATAPKNLLPDPTGRWVLTQPWDENRIRLWELDSLPGAEPLVLRRSGSWYASTFGIHPEGKWLAAATTDWQLTFWPIGRPRPHVAGGYSGLRRPVVFSPDGRWVGTVHSPSGRIRLFPVPGTGEELIEIEVPEPNLWCNLAFDHDQRFVHLVGNADRSYVVPLDGSPPRQLDLYSDETLLDAAGVSPSGRFVATGFLWGEGERTLRVWDVGTGAVRTFPLPAGDHESSKGKSVFLLRFQDDTTLFTIGGQGVLKWNLQTGSHEVVSELSNGNIFPGGAFCGDERTVLTVNSWGERCNPVFAVDLDSGASRELPHLGECASALACDGTGSIFASGDLDGVIRVGRKDGTTPHVLVGHRSLVANLAISPDGEWIASAGEDNTLRLWPMPDLDEPPLHTLPHEKLITRLQTLTNLRAVRDESGPGWKIEVGPFPGWRDVPEW